MPRLALVPLTALLIGPRLVPFAPATRGRPVALVGGENASKGVFAVAAVAGLLGAFSAAAAVPVVVPWTPGEALRWLTLVATLPALVLVASADVGTGGTRPARHPMLAGIGLRALVHALADGTLGDVVLFGALAADTPVALVASDRRDAARDRDGFARRAEATALVPFVTVVRTGGAGLDGRGPLAGAPIRAVVLALHPRLFGVSPLATALGRGSRPLTPPPATIRRAAAVRRPPVGVS